MTGEDFPTYTCRYAYRHNTDRDNTRFKELVNISKITDTITIIDSNCCLLLLM